MRVGPGRSIKLPAMSMTREVIVRRREELVERFGPWTAYNIHLGQGVYTIAPGVFGMAEQRVERVTQLVCDFAARPLEQLRVLDLGAYEGGFSVELARRGTIKSKADLQAIVMRHAKRPNTYL